MSNLLSHKASSLNSRGWERAAQDEVLTGTILTEQSRPLDILLYGQRYHGILIYRRIHAPREHLDNTCIDLGFLGLSDYRRLLSDRVLDCTDHEDHISDRVLH